MTKIGLVLMALAMSAAILWSNAGLSEDTLDRAISLAAEERYREARLTLNPLLEREPASSHSRLLHGILRLYEGDRDEAIDTFRSLMRDFPDLFEAYNNLAVVYVQEGRLEDARGVLLGILERQPESIGYRNLGDIYVKLARGAYARARELGFDTTAIRERSQPVRPPPPRTSDPAASAAPGTAQSGVRTKDRSARNQIESPSAALAAADAACVSVGEFEARDDVEDAKRWLRSRGAEILAIAEESRETIKSHRVYIPPLDSRKSALRIMRELKSRGIRDVAVILRGELRNAVSLGVYRSRVNAETRMTNLKRLGYSVQSAANTTTRQEYVTIQARLSGSRDALFNAWTSQFSANSFRHVDCA